MTSARSKRGTNGATARLSTCGRGEGAGGAILGGGESAALTKELTKNIIISTMKPAVWHTQLALHISSAMQAQAASRTAWLLALLCSI